jgi:hypothetical protein
MDTEQAKAQLKVLDFKQMGKLQDYSANLSKHNSQAFFDAVYDLIMKIAQQWDKSLT